MKASQKLKTRKERKRDAPEVSNTDHAVGCKAAARFVDEKGKQQRDLDPLSVPQGDARESFWAIKHTYLHAWRSGPGHQPLLHIPHHPPPSLSSYSLFVGT